MSILDHTLFNAQVVHIDTGDILLLQVGNESYVPLPKDVDEVRDELLAALAARGVINVSVVYVPFPCRITQMKRVEPRT